MSSSFPVYRHHGSATFALLSLVLVAVIIFLVVGATESAFGRIGFSRLQVIALLAGTFLGSAVNFPLFRVKSSEKVVTLEEVRFFWMTYRIPRLATQEVSTLVAVNFGGAVIPVAVSAYLLYLHSTFLVQALVGVGITAILVHLVARRVPGVGIATPALIPPIVAAITAYLIAPAAPTVVAYVAGTVR